MYDLLLKWKEFKIHSGKLHSILRSVAGPLYCGISCNDDLVVHFKEKPATEYITRVQEQYSLLTEAGEAAKFKRDSDEKAAIELAKASLVTADLMKTISAERKLLLGLPLNSDDKAALLAKYPQ